MNTAPSLIFIDKHTHDRTVTMTVAPKLFFTYVIVTILVETKSEFSHAPPLSPTIEDRLNREERNAICCSKKMRCCKRTVPSSNIEIRAVIARCIDPPNPCHKDRNLKKSLDVGSAHQLQRFQGFDEDEPLIQSEVTKCMRKVILTIKMKNDGETPTKQQYIVIDHVYDPLSEKTVRLLNPYVIKMKQEQLSQAYGLRFVDFVNSQAKEQVFNKHDGNYTGCCVDSKKPTCGLISYHGRPIPFSQGFCCSCDAEKNVARQPVKDPNINIAYSDPAFLYDALQCPRTSISDEEKNSAIKPENLKKKKKKNKKKKKKKGRRENHNKRGMEAVDDDDSDLFFIDKNMKYHQNLRGVKSKHVSSSDSNYKIQSMNDQYEDQLSNQVNFPTHLESTTTEGEDTQNTETLENKPTDVTSTHKGETVNPIQEDKIYEQKKKLMLDTASAKQRGQKPSVHKLLRMSKSPSSGKFYDFNADIKKIADQAFQNAINSYSDMNKAKSRLTRDEPIPEPFHKFYSKRQVQSSGVQRRGGQNCADRYTPPNLNPETYHESTHCLRFSPIWYGVYKMDKPVVDQTVIFQVYQKYETESGTVHWRDLTKGQKIKLGTFFPYYEDKLPTIAMAFYSVFDDEDFCLNWNRLRLLIPEGVPPSEVHNYPEARGGPAEYLMVPVQKIVLSGDQCDVAGVGFEAFYKQPNRCSMPRGSCLQHQPYHLWHYDKTAERAGKKGCFFLKHHGKLSKNPITKNETTNEKYLILNYYGKYVSMVDMEINADFNAVLRPTSLAVITEVYIDSTCASSTSIVVKVSNNGLLSSRFKVRVCDCPLDLQHKLDELQSDLVIIPPQHQHIFKLNFHSQVQADIFHCSVEALNAQDELVALRRIRVQKMDRCICTWHCLCACIGSSSGLKCIPMKLDHYHAAGFKGGLPIISYIPRDDIAGDVYRLIIFILLFILFTLLILGLTKAILGLCCLPIGVWGLNTLLDLPKPMKKYYERSLAGRPVVYDSSGWPIHPDTRQRVKNIPKPTEFATNVLFFFTYPTVVFLLVIKRLCCPFYSYEKIRKPKQHIKKNWFKKRKCDLKTCMSRGMQTDEDAASIESTGSKNKKKKLEKRQSRSKEKFRQEEADNESPSKHSRGSSLTKQPSDSSTGSKGKKKKKKEHKSRSPTKKSFDSKKGKKSTSPKNKSKFAKCFKSPKRSKSPKGSTTEVGDDESSRSPRDRSKSPKKKSRFPKCFKSPKRSKSPKGSATEVDEDEMPGSPRSESKSPTKKSKFPKCFKSPKRSKSPEGSVTEVGGDEKSRSPRSESKSPKKKSKFPKCFKSPKKSKSPVGSTTELGGDEMSRSPRNESKSPTKKSKFLKCFKSPRRSKSPKGSASDIGEDDQQKKKPTIKVSIKQHKKNRSRSVSPKRRSSIEISDNPYYYSSTDEAAYSTSSPSVAKTRKGRKGSRTSSA